MSKITAAIVALVLLFSSSIGNAQIFVTQSGAGAKNGTTWANAFGASQLAGALLAATPGSQFWIAAGTYTPHPTVRDSSFRLLTGVKIYGGFTGTETMIAQRNWTLNKTILSGDINTPNDSSDNSYNVMRISLADSNTTVDGCVITRGCANTSQGLRPSMGGGIYIWLESPFIYPEPCMPRIRNCSFLRNTAMEGGAIVFRQSFDFLEPVIENCVFENNVVLPVSNSKGGGAFLVTSVANTTHPYNVYVRNCVFRNNTSGRWGGAVSVSSQGYLNMEIHNSVFENNHADESGGGLYAETDHLGPANTDLDISVINCQFIANKATTQGGGIYTRFARGTATMTIDRSHFEGNHSITGAGIVLRSSGVVDAPKTNTIITNSSFIKNTRTFGFGGGGTAIYTTSGSSGGAGTTDTTLIANCLFINNPDSGSNFASAILNDANQNGKRQINFINNTVYHDLEASKTTSGSAMIINAVGTQTSGSQFIECNIYNSILWMVPAYLNSVVPIANSPQKVTCNIGNSIVFNSGGSTAWKSTYGSDKGNNYDTPPGFIDTFSNFRLRCDAFARNKGSNARIPAGISLDLDKVVRIHNSFVDIGAYESLDLPPVATPASATLNLKGTFVDKTPGGQVDSVQWDFGDGNKSKLDSVVHQYADSGTYNVCLKVFSNCGSDDTCFQVKITKGTSVEKHLTGTLGVRVYPNPVSDLLQVESTAIPYDVQIVNLLGQPVYYFGGATGKTSIDMGNLPVGTYILVVSDKTSSVRRTILKQ